ncbi:MAG: aminoglycoside phosphotransferase family protein [Candidatus Heimdallarchaeota archaeon]
MSYKSKEPITNEVIIKIIMKHFPEQKIQAVSEITESFVNPVYTFSLDSNESYILKFNNPRWPMKQRREIESMKKVQSNTSVPTPNVFAFSSNKEPIPYMILEKAPGMELRQVIKSKELTTDEVLSIIQKIGFFLGELHTIKFDFFGDFTSIYNEVDKTKNFLWGNRFQTWQSCFKAYCQDILNWTDRESFPEYRKKLLKEIDEYAANVPSTTEACFVHSDIQPSNIIINKKDISAIIDFEWSFAGSASFDFYMTKAGFYFSIFPTVSSIDIYANYSNLNHQRISQAFIEGYSKSNPSQLDTYPDDFMDFIWLLYMIGSWNWSKSSSIPEEIAQYEADIHKIYSQLIK